VWWILHRHGSNSFTAINITSNHILSGTGYVPNNLRA
jgi:hypothetical protein